MTISSRSKSIFSSLSNGSLDFRYWEQKKIYRDDIFGRGLLISRLASSPIPFSIVWVKYWTTDLKYVVKTSKTLMLMTKECSYGEFSLERAHLSSGTHGSQFAPFPLVLDSPTPAQSWLCLLPTASLPHGVESTPTSSMLCPLRFHTKWTEPSCLTTYLLCFKTNNFGTKTN